MKDESVRDQLKLLRTRAGYSVRKLAHALGYGERYSTYSTYEQKYKGHYLSVAMVERLAPLLVGRGEPPITSEEVWSLAGIGGDTFPATPVPRVAPVAYVDPSEMTEIPEYDLSKLPHGAVEGQSVHSVLTSVVPTGSWYLPKDLIRSVDEKHSKLFIARVNDSTMSPKFLKGDPILVDRSHSVVTNDGFYLLWDGVRCFLKQVTRSPGRTSPKLRLRSLNGDYAEEEIEEDFVQIVGQVAAHWSWL